MAVLLLFSMALAQLVSVQAVAAAGLDTQHHCTMMTVPGTGMTVSDTGMPDCTELSPFECADEHCMASSVAVTGVFTFGLAPTFGFERSANTFADSALPFPPDPPPIF